MEWQATWDNPMMEYLRHFDGLMGDARTRVTFGETVRGILSAGTLICRQIASHSAVLSTAKDGAQRVIRFATGESTKRSQVDAEHLTQRLRERGVAQLADAETDEVWLILDGSDLRKRYAREMEKLMQVRDLNGDLVPGYRTLNVLGVTPGRRGILYQRLFSSLEDDFLSESAEVQLALQTVSQALEPLKARMAVTWLMDRGMDDVAVWRTIWEQQEHIVCRIAHTERLVDFQDDNQEWQTGHIEQARRHLRLMATAGMRMKIRLGRQKRAKWQQVTAELWVRPIRLTYQTNVRREGPGQTVQKPLWLVEVRLQKSHWQPWLLITDWPVTDEASAVRILQMYRQRWAVEDSFKFTKECLGWEDVQLLDLTGIRTLAALAWVAAGFLYELGITWEWPEVQLLARLGGWVERKDRKPGKIVITRGLRRLLDAMTTDAFLNRYIAEHGALPPRIAALLSHPSIPDL
jgi:hypothetical protein